MLPAVVCAACTAVANSVGAVACTTLSDSQVTQCASGYSLQSLGADGKAGGEGEDADIAATP